MTRKIVYITGTRADYGLMQRVLLAISSCEKLTLEIIATGMHFMEEFGMTIEEVRKSGFAVHEINEVFEDDFNSSAAAFTGRLIEKLTEKFKTIGPDIVLLLGDRAEMLSAAIVCNYMSIPAFHLHGGELTSTADEPVRHAITRLSHIHLPATEKSANRLRIMGEEPERIYVTGAPGLDEILSGEYTSSSEILKKYDIRTGEQFIIMLQHPVSIEARDSSMQIIETLEALNSLSMPVIVIYSNADAGGRQIIESIKKYHGNGIFRVYSNIPRKDFLGLMRTASVMVGNSSSGIIEAPSFGLPVVNIGTRQLGRDRGGNVIDAGYDRREIAEAIRKALSDPGFRKKENIYGDGKAAERIVDLLCNIEISSKLLQKHLSLE